MRPFALLVLPLATACAAIPLQGGAETVIVSRAPAAKSCRFVRSIVGSQGDFISGAFTSNAALAEGAMNDMKNKAAELGANYVVLETNQAGMSYSAGSTGGFGSQTDVTSTGNAYACPPEEIGLAPLAARVAQPVAASSDENKRE